MGGAASVKLKEIDLSTRVATFEGVYGGIVIPAKKGQLDKPSLVTSDTQFLSRYTPDGSVKVGYDLSYFSALAYLERSNKLWVQRVANGAYFAGCKIQKAGSSANSAGLSAGSNVSVPSSHVFGADEVLFIYAANEGAWGNNIQIKIETIDANPDLIEENSFKISVYKVTNGAALLESFLVSRVMGQKDGKGRNMFVEDVLEASSYIRAISNPEIDDTVLPKEQSSALVLADGNDGSAVTDANMIAAANKFANRSQVSVTILMDGGYSVPAYQVALDTIAQSRQDCVAILTTPYANEVSADYLNDLISYRKSDLNLNSSFSALYTPHLKIADKFNDRNLWIAPDGHIAGSISFSANNYEIWYPAAGFKRGVLNVLDVAQRFSDGELDSLYNAGINPVKFFPGRGIVVWGQKTLLSRASALDRLNVRLLLIVIEPAIRDLLENFLFELNDDGTRSIISTKIESYLEGIKARKGVTDFAVVCDETNNTPADIDNNRLNVDIYVKPSISIEEIPVRVVITPNNISFADAATAV